MNSLILIVGCGAHGRICAETACLLGFKVLGFADDDPAKRGRDVGSYRVLGTWQEISADFYFVAVGMNSHRERIFHELQSAGKQLATLVHPFSYVSPGARLGNGSVVLPGSVIQAGAVVHDNVIVNIRTAIDHDAVVQSHSHLAPGSVVCSFGEVGRGEVLQPGTVRFRPQHR